MVGEILWPKKKVGLCRNSAVETLESQIHFSGHFLLSLL
jgi:hypothetical protein